MIDPVRDVAIWRWDLKGEAFGTTAPDQDPDKDGTAFVFDMRFPGQRYDALSGLNRNYFRDYEAGTGRYVQSDPIGLAGGIGTFIYAQSRPVSAIDFYGLESVDSFNNGGHRMSWEDGPKRTPDYFKLQSDLYVFSFSITLSRSGKVFVGGGFARNYLTYNTKTPGISLSAGFLNQCDDPSGSEVDNFIGGFGMGAAGGYRGIGGAFAWSPGQGTATEVGLGIGAGASPGEVTTEKWRIGSGW
ncbi:RHS repeat-associated protein [Xanthomonas sacchari]|nr:RHS repeat-associated protein [Xanthomonas sp. F10]